MRVLMISGDPRIEDPASEVGKRLALQRAQVEKLVVHIWPQRSILAPLRERGRFDVVTSQDPFWRGVIAWIAARRAGAKFNVQVHTDLAAQSFLRHLLAHIVLRHADSVRVVSEKIKEQITHMGIRAPIAVLPVYIDVTTFIGLTHRPHPRFQKTILWLGRFEKEKDPFDALTVLREVRKKGIDAGLVMLGAGSMEKQLRHLAEGLPVEFPGWQAPEVYLEMADVVLCTSLHESWGASIVEALAAGVPVVAPDVGVAREAGAVVVPREKLADAIIDVLHAGTQGALALQVLSAEEWARRWRKTLV